MDTLVILHLFKTTCSTDFWGGGEIFPLHLAKQAPRSGMQQKMMIIKPEAQNELDIAAEPISCFVIL